MDSTTVLDLNWMGRPHSIGAVLLESGGHNAVLDPGPASTLETLRGQMLSRGLSVSDLEAILLTHIHLDHAGATGTLLRENPNLRVFVHSRGAAHLVIPRNYSPARGACGAMIFRVYSAKHLRCPSKIFKFSQVGRLFPWARENLMLF